MYNLTIVASADGGSYYRIYVDQVDIKLGPKADRKNEAKHHDVLYEQDPYYAQGYVGNGGIDSYYTGRYGGYDPDKIPHYSVANNGNATLYIYVNGNQTQTVAPGEGMEGLDFGPSATPAGNNTITVKAAGDGASNYTLSSKNESYNPIYLGNKAEPYTTATHLDYSNSPIPAEIYPNAGGFVGNGGIDTFSSDYKLTKVTNSGTTTLKIYQNNDLWAIVRPGETISKGKQSHVGSTNETTST